MVEILKILGDCWGHRADDLRRAVIWRREKADGAPSAFEIERWGTGLAEEGHQSTGKHDVALDFDFAGHKCLHAVETARHHVEVVFGVHGNF